MTARKKSAQPRDEKITNVLEHIGPEFVLTGARRITLREVDEVVRSSEEIEEAFGPGNTLERFGKDGRQMLRLLRDFHEGRYTDAPLWAIAVTGFIFCYVMKPIDIIPDTLPVIGQLDDAVVVTLGLDMIQETLEDHRAWQKEAGAE